MGERKYFLDWLRVIAFGLLIAFHVGMLYVTWDYNLKSPRQFPDLELAMNSLSAWRLVLLFFISGVASRFLLEKLSAGPYARDRTRRLLPVILLAMLVINPPQVYVELWSEGWVSSGYLEFWFTSYLAGDTYPGRMLPTWDHLWFVVYLLVYGWLLAAMVGVMGPITRRVLPVGVLVVVPGVLLAATNVLVSEVRPVTFSLVDDWANHIRWLCIFGVGLLCAPQDGFWAWLRDRRRALLGVSLVLFAVQLANGIHWRQGGQDPFWDGIAFSALAGVYGWSVVLTVCGFAAAWLDRPSALLTWLTDAVLPIYVLHQPVMLVCAFVVFPMALPLPVEVSIIVMVTGAGSVLGYQAFVRRPAPIRFLFGLKPRVG